MFSLEYLTFPQIITVLHENFQKLFENGNGDGGGGGGGSPLRPVRLCLTQAFLQVAQQAISLIKPLLHFEAFR